MSMLGIIISLIAATAPANSAPAASPLEARRVLQKFASCTVKNARALTSTALVEDWSIPMMVKRDIITPDCLDSGTLSGWPAPMKGALGEQLVITEKSELPPAQVAASPSLSMRELDPAYFWKGEYPANPKPDDEKALKNFRAYVVLSQLGECIVRTDATSSRALLGAKVGSGHELALARVLAPALTRCVPAGQTVTVNAEAVRRAVGLAYYRMEMAARGVLWQPAGEAK